MSLAWSVRSRAARLGLVASMLGLASLLGAAPVGAASEITLSTPYPAVAASPGSTVNFDISITTDTPDRVDLTVTGAPADWTATLRGGGFTVDGVETDGTKDADQGHPRGDRPCGRRPRGRSGSRSEA